MGKDTETNEGNASEVQTLEDLDSESIEVIKIADRKKDKSSDDQGEELRIWRCQGVSIGLHIQKKKR